MMYAPDVKSEIRHIMLIIYRCRNEGMAVLGEHLMYDEFYPDKESPYYDPYEEIQDRDYYSDVKNASRRLDFFVDFLEQLLELAKRSWVPITNKDFQRKEDDIVYRCDVVLIEAMRTLGLISDDVARSYGNGYNLDSLKKEDRSHIMQTALSMTLPQPTGAATGACPRLSNGKSCWVTPRTSGRSRMGWKADYSLQRR
ncbi:MAG: hypothetical protein IKW93_00055, partial [Bacteroidales bacterium]|nr:hypothetical protein [Bacteroidales bacterium]